MCSGLPNWGACGEGNRSSPDGKRRRGDHAVGFETKRPSWTIALIWPKSNLGVEAIPLEFWTEDHNRCAASILGKVSAVHDGPFVFPVDLLYQIDFFRNSEIQLVIQDEEFGPGFGCNSG